jgi:hypothetical protein
VLRVAWRKFFRDSIPEKPKPGHSRLKVALHSPTITTAGFSQPQTQLASSRLVGRQPSERWQLTTTELQSRPYWPRRWLHRRLKGYWTSYVRKRVKKTAHTLPATRAPTLSRTLKASVPSSVNTQAVELLRVQSPATRPRLPSLPRTLNELDDLAPHHAPDSEEETSAPSVRTIPLLSDRDLEGSLLAVAACGKVKVALHA